MDDIAKARFEVCKNHPKQQEIFKLEQLLIEAGYPYYFNVWEDLRPTPFDQDGGNPETDINWDEYNFLIEVGRPSGYGYSEISVGLSSGMDHTLLELLDMRPAAGKENPTLEDGELHIDLTAEMALGIIEKFFNGAE